MKKKIVLSLVMLLCCFMAQVYAAQRVTLRVAQFPLTVQSYMTPSQDVQDNLERLVDRSLHIPLNGTLNAVYYIPEKECWEAFDAARAEAFGKVKLKDLMRPVAEKLKADLVVMPVLTGYEQYQTMSWNRWGRYITHSYASVEIIGYDKSKDEVFSKGASRQYNDEYSTQAEVSRLACEAMDDSLRSAKVNERVWIWKNR
ncbi:MAG: hypothetical protein IIY91_07410 [Selenomonas sp.]|nr:hypothetical protein [Selenomonas sp.]